MNRMEKNRTLVETCIQTFSLTLHYIFLSSKIGVLWLWCRMLGCESDIIISSLFIWKSVKKHNLLNQKYLKRCISHSWFICFFSSKSFSRFAVVIFSQQCIKSFCFKSFCNTSLKFRRSSVEKKQCFSSLFCFHPKVFNHRGISIHFPQNIKQTFYIVIFLMVSTHINQNIFLSRISSIHISSRNL